MAQNLTVFMTSLCTITALASTGASASHTEDTNPQEVGSLSPLIPVPKDAIHAGVSATAKNALKICFGMRPSEYAGHHLVNEDGSLNEIFEQLVYGGFGFSEGAHGLDESNIKGDHDRENFMCWDLTHPDAFNDTGEFAIVDEHGEALVTPDDFGLNAASFSDAGDLSDLNYNIFCAGNVALHDGRWLFIGGHDKSGNNGIRKLPIFDPVSQTWADRSIPPVKEDFLADPEGTGEHADPLDEENTDPPHPSDMKYQRWYPTGVVLPDKKVLILSGTDQDTSLGPPGTQFFPPCGTLDESAACSKVRQPVPEIYDPKTDRTVALENAAKLLAMYPRAYVVQTGAGRRDWKVAVISEANPDHLPGLDAIGQYDPYFYDGKTYLLDVNAALADARRDSRAENHWHEVGKAAIGHDSGAGVQLWELDKSGRAAAQRIVLFGGGCGREPAGTECDSSAVEMIDFEDDHPSWRRQADLIQPASQNNAVVLPDGRAVIIGGATGRGPWNNSFFLQMYDQHDGSVRPLVETHVARHDHSTAALLPDGSVAILGGNATDLSGELEHLDVGIPVAQIYQPPYLFKGPGPTIRYAPRKMFYGAPYPIVLDRKGETRVKSVALVRMGPVTHNWDWGNRYVKLAFRQAHVSPQFLFVSAPAVPGLAVPGYYMLFVVSEKGVPSVAEIVHLDDPGALHPRGFFGRAHLER